MMKPLGALALFCTVLAGCENPGAGINASSGPTSGNQPNRVVSVTQGLTRAQIPSTAVADSFARAYLDTVQARSFSNRREFCGYFFVDGAGNLQSTPPIRGTLDSCPRTEPPNGVFASWHTHGAYDRDYDNEVPSPPDMIGTFQFGYDGYIATPGGRLWRVEVDNQTAIQVCSEGCLSVDPRNVAEPAGSIPRTYTLRTLLARFTGGQTSGRQISQN